jgi:hypothetical protein
MKTSNFWPGVVPTEAGVATFFERRRFTLLTKGSIPSLMMLIYQNGQLHKFSIIRNSEVDT